jgi:hypothetical protein
MDLTDLYRGPLEEFVARRTRLVRETRSADPSAAEAIGKVRKPPVSVWAIDQLATDRQQLLNELLAAGADASEAQRGVSAQSETRESLLLASNRVRDAVEAAARGADDVLEKAGHARGDETGRRIRATLQAAATGSAADRLALWRGTLDHEVASSGFGALDGPDEDAAELAAVLAPLRRSSSHTRTQPRPRQTRPDDERLQREAAELAAKKASAAAERARDLATSKRNHADRLAEEARTAAQEATAAEESAEKAEDAARVAHLALSRSARRDHGPS